VADVCAPARGRRRPTALVLLWLRPIVNETVSHDPPRAPARAAARDQPSCATSITSGSRPRFGRSGASPSPR
jgi:hypothetical protein